MPAHEWIYPGDVEGFARRLNRTVPEVREMIGRGQLRACRLSEAPNDAKRVENFSKHAYSTEKLNALAGSSGGNRGRLSAMPNVRLSAGGQMSVVKR